MDLVTGATGHIGNVLVRCLLERGKEVRVLILPGEDASPLEGLGVERVEGDITDLESMKRAMHGVERVFHLAGIISIMPGKNPHLHLVNVEGTRNIVRACLSSGVRRLVYTSSIHAIQRVEDSVIVDEALPFDPENNAGEYDCSKARASLAVLDSVCQEGLDAVIVCPTGVIGPYDFRGSEMGEVIRDAADNHLRLILEGAYDFVDVRDVAQGLILAAEKGKCGETYILSGERITIDSLVRTVEDLTGKHTWHLKMPLWMARLASHLAPWYYRLVKVKPRFTPYSLGTLLSNSFISANKARQELGYQARPLRESIRDTIEWMRQRRAATF